MPKATSLARVVWRGCAFRKARTRVSEGTDARFGRYELSYRPKLASVPSDTYIRAVRYAPAMMVTTPPNTLTTNALLTVGDHSTTSVQRSPDNGRDDAVSGSHITTIPIHPVTGQMGIAGNRRSRLLHLLVHSLQGDRDIGQNPHKAPANQRGGQHHDRGHKSAGTEYFVVDVLVLGILYPDNVE